MSDVEIFIVFLAVMAAIILLFWLTGRLLGRRVTEKGRKVREHAKSAPPAGDPDFYERNLRAMRENFLSASEKKSHLPARVFHTSLRRMQRTFRDAERLLATGNVYYGYIVQANREVYREFSKILPAIAVFGDDPFFDRNPEALRKIALGLFERKGTPMSLNEEYRKYIEDEYAVPCNVLLPPELCGGRRVYLTALALPPQDVLFRVTSGILPLVAKPGELDTALVLNGEWWTDEMRLSFACPSFKRELPADETPPAC